MGTSVKADFDESVPLLRILNEMPEVAEARPEFIKRKGPGSFSPSFQLPKKVWVVLKAYTDPKQLSLPFDARATA